jgi:4-hydroxybutyrate CoA-transferase
VRRFDRHAHLLGIGGQMDFIRGSALSPGGKPIIALPSTAAGGTALAHRRP